MRAVLAVAIWLGAAGATNAQVLRLDFEGAITGCNAALNQCPLVGVGPDGSRAGGFYGAYPDTANDGDYLAIPKTPALSDLTRGTIAFWIRYDTGFPDDVTKIATPLDTYDKTGQVGNESIGTPGTWQITRNFYPNHNLYVFNDAGQRTLPIVFPDASVFTDTKNGISRWHYYAVTWDGTNIRGYFDGKLFQTTAQTGITALTMGKYLAVGAHGHSDLPEAWVQKYPNHGFINGALDEVRIYDYALPESDINRLFVTPSASVAPSVPAAPRDLRILR